MNCFNVSSLEAVLWVVFLRYSEAPVCKVLKASTNHILTLSKLFTNMPYHKAGPFSLQSFSPPWNGLCCWPLLGSCLRCSVSMELQNGLEWKGPLKLIQSSPLPGAGTPSTRSGFQSPIQPGLDLFQSWDSHSFSGQPHIVIHHPHSEKFLPFSVENHCPLLCPCRTGLWSMHS